MATVRVARAQDAAPLAKLAAETFPLACPPGLGAEDVAAFVAAQLGPERFATHIGSPSTDVLLVEHSGVLVGYALLHDAEPPADVRALLGPGPAAEVGKFFLAAGEHGHGTASDLMATVLGRARDAGAEQVWLGVSRENGRANRFYEKQGFALVGTKAFTVGSVTFPADHVRALTLGAGARSTDPG